MLKIEIFPKKCTRILNSFFQSDFSPETSLNGILKVLLNPFLRLKAFSN